LRDALERTKPLFTDKSPFENPPRIPERIQWVKPNLVCEISFAEWTRDGELRQTVFFGWRDDKKAKEGRPANKAWHASPAMFITKLLETAAGCGVTGVRERRNRLYDELAFAHVANLSSQVEGERLRRSRLSAVSAGG